MHVLRSTIMVPRLTAASIAASLAIGSVLLPSIALAQSPIPTTDTSLGLSIQYVDGRITTRPLRSSGGMWTPKFPRIDGADTPREGVPLTTLDVRHVVDGRDVVVTVSLSYGGPRKNEVKVATVRVAPDRPVQVNELRAFGVEPITLSIVPIPATVEYAPEVLSVSGQVEARAETVGPNASAYRVVVRNRSSLALMWFHFKAYRDDRTAISGRPRGKRNVPLIPPNGEHTFEVTSSSSGELSGDSPGAWQPLDRIEITSLLWQDGLVEGDPEPALQQGWFDTSKAMHIRALMTLLRDARERSIASLRSEIARAMTFDIETQQLRDSLLADLDALERTQRSGDGQDFETWLTRTIAECRQWVARIVVPKS
jgi:hypothetical protein